MTQEQYDKYTKLTEAIHIVELDLNRWDNKFTSGSSFNIEPLPGIHEEDWKQIKEKAIANLEKEKVFLESKRENI